MKGNHLEDNCWTKYPEKRPKLYTPKKDRKGKGRGRSRSKSVEKEERKKGRENSPYPVRVVRAKDRLTDRDSDESENDESVKELERDYLEAKEKAKETKEKYNKQIKRTRRVRTGKSGGIFTDEITEAQYNRMEREAARGQGPSRNIRRVKKQVICSTSFWGAAS